MAKFLTQSEIYKLLQRELPENLYYQGPPSQSYSGAELDSTAKVLRQIYSQAESIYHNMFPTTVDEQLNEWEIKCFGTTDASGKSTSERVGSILAHLRSSANLSTWDLLVGIASIAVGTYVEIIQNNELYYFGSIDCRGENADEIWGPDWYLGKPLPENAFAEPYILNSQAQLLALRERAFGYIVKVYSTALSDRLKADIETFITKSEASRSAHVVQYIDQTLNEIVENPSRFSKKIAIKIMPDGTIQAASTDIFFGFEGDDRALGFGDVNDDTVGGNFFSLN